MRGTGMRGGAGPGGGAGAGPATRGSRARIPERRGTTRACSREDESRGSRSSEDSSRAGEG